MPGADETTPGFLASCAAYEAGIEEHIGVLNAQREAGFIDEGRHADEITYWNGVLEMVRELADVLKPVT